MSVTKDDIMAEINLLMKKKKIRANFLAKKLDMSRVTVSKMANTGEGTIDNYEKIINYLRGCENDSDKENWNKGNWQWKTNKRRKRKVAEKMEQPNAKITQPHCDKHIP